MLLLDQSQRFDRALAEHGFSQHARAACLKAAIEALAQTREQTADFQTQALMGSTVQLICSARSPFAHKDKARLFFELGASGWRVGDAERLPLSTSSDPWVSGANSFCCAPRKIFCNLDGLLDTSRARLLLSWIEQGLFPLNASLPGGLGPHSARNLLSIAAGMGWGPWTSRLLALGADPNAISGFHGWSPLRTCAETFHRAGASASGDFGDFLNRVRVCADILLEAGADPLAIASDGVSSWDVVKNDSSDMASSLRSAMERKTLDSLIPCAHSKARPTL
jgi:hypothetical protein